MDGGGIIEKVTLAKAFADELNRPSVRELQKRARKRPAATRSESWTDSEFQDLPPVMEIPGAELDAQFVRDAAGNVIRDADDSTDCGANLNRLLQLVHSWTDQTRRT